MKISSAAAVDAEQPVRRVLVADDTLTAGD